MFHLKTALLCALAVSYFSLASCAAPLAKPLPAAPIIMPGDRMSAQSKTPLLLAENGKALMPIVVARDASGELKAAAEHLASRLEKITSAKWEITTGDGASGIVIGTWAQFPVESLKKPLEIRAALPGLSIANGREAYAVKTEAKRVLLLGGGELGASHAATRFLELIGYRHFYPGKEWEIVPDLKTLKFDRDETDRPRILARAMWHAFGFPEDMYTAANATWPQAKFSERGRAEIAQWNRQNRMCESFRVHTAHNWMNIPLGINAEEFKAHPEYHGIYNGERNISTICDSNPRVRELAGEMAIDYFKTHPEADMISLEPHDGDAMCQCEQCRAVGNYSERVYALINVAARMVQKEAPGKMIGVLGYYQHDVPPSFDLEPNVHVQLVRLFAEGPYPPKELLRLWRAKTRNVGVHEHFSTYVHGQDRLRARMSAGPTADVATLTDTIRYAASQDVLSLFSESSIAWGAHGRGNYLATRLLWNPDANVEEILQDFYDKAFGPAAKPMQRYFGRVDGENEQFSKTLLGLAMRDVQEASRLAKDRPDVQARVDWIKQFLFYNYLQYRTINAKDAAEGKPLIFKLLRHEYLSRNRYMTHWRGLQEGVNQIAKDYGEPEWGFPDAAEFTARRDAGLPPRVPSWHREEPYTPAETEQNFQEALEFFQPAKLLPRAEYSHDLVPIDWGANNISPDFQVANLRRGTVYLYSFKGEPIELDLVGAKSETDTFYVLEDMKGNRIEGGTIVSDDEKHHLSLKVPRAGLYRFHANARGWWLYSVSPKTSHTIELADQQEISSWTSQGEDGISYFYVPKGTKEFQFFWGGEKTNIYFPDGQVAAEVPPLLNDYFSISVAEGLDGKLWSFWGRHQPRQFVNIPNFISPWKDGLMLPRELATKDGLKIRGE